MTDEELAGQPGAVATRAEDEADAAVAEPVFSPKDFRLNLGARLAVADEPLASVAAHLGVVDDEPLPNLDSPAIRTLTWEHVVPDRPASSAPSAATLAPLPPPRRVPPPPVNTFEPPASTVPPEAVVEVRASVVVEEAPVEEVIEDEFVETDQVDGDVVDVDDESVDEVLDDDLEADHVAEEFEDDVESAEVEAQEVEAQEVEAQEVEPHEVAEVAQTAAPVGQPEVNRLGSVPDLFDDDDDAPIELPPITPSARSWRMPPRRPSTHPCSPRPSTSRRLRGRQRR